MNTAVAIAAASAVVMTALLVLFSVERSRGVRVAEPLRRALDASVVRLDFVLARFAAVFHYRRFLLLMYTLPQPLVRRGLRILSWLEARLRVLQRRHTTLLDSVHAPKQGSIFNEMQRHKETASLSETEKRARKARALESEE